MDIQIVLNWTIQILVMGFVCLMVMDFVNGLFSLPYYAIAKAAKNPGAFATKPEPVAAPIPEQAITPDSKEQPQFAQLADPWFSTDIQPTPIQQESVLLGFPSVRLLPPAAQVQPKSKVTRKSTDKAKSTTTEKSSKLSNKASTQKSFKSRKSAAV